MFLRDVLMDQAYFDMWIEYDLKKIEEKEQASKKPGVNPKYDAQFSFQIFRKYYQVLIARYSRGDPLSDLKASFPDLVDAWECATAEELKVFTPEEMANRKQFSRNLDIYIVCLWLVSLARCLEVDEALFARILALCGNEGEDWLFEHLAHAPGRKVAGTLCYPKTHRALKDAIEEPNQRDRVRLMQRFLTGWYPSLNKTYWHDNHKGVDGGGYFGYWCFEAAAVVKLGGWDDSDWRNMPYYPKHLVTASR
jgi:hypothetical protein